MPASIWGDVPTWLAGIGTCGAVIVSLYLARQDGLRREQHEKRRQAEMITAWLGPAQSSGDGLYEVVVLQNSSMQSVYQLVACLVSIQGSFRETAVGDSRGFRSTVGQVPPGQQQAKIESAGHGMQLKLGVELAFQDAAGVFWLRRGNGLLEEVHEDPATLYKLTRPVGWGVG